MKFIGNVLWFFTFGCISAALWSLAGIIWSLTIIGIPFGKQCFKLAKLSFAPIGKKVKLNSSEHPVANAVWAILGGWVMALLYLFVGIINCITIIGISRGIQCFKIMKLAFFPFGAKIK